MPYKNEFFTAVTVGTMLPDDNALPLSQAALNDLRMLLADDGDYTFASLKSDSKYEAVRIVNMDGDLVVERGIEGTEAVRHPFHTCVSLVQPALLAALKDLVCNYNCCEGGPCDCSPVTITQVELPVAYKNLAWNGVIMFGGDLPMYVESDMGQTRWITVTRTNNVVRLSGTPTETGRFNFSISASNCNGNLVTRACEVVVQDLG